jgi:hypothetical protein
MQRFLAVFTLLLSLFSSISTAQTITIGTETNLGTGRTGSLPINPYYGYSYSQSFYLADEIDATGTITAIKYHFHGTSLANSRVLKIYMAQLSDKAFPTNNNQSWVNRNLFTLVYDGTIDSVSGYAWIRIPLTTPFAYNGVDNLVIGVDENNPSFDGVDDKFYYSNASSSAGFRSLCFYSDTYNPNPLLPLPGGLLVAAYPNVQIEGLTLNCKRPVTPSVSDNSGTSIIASWTAPTTGPLPTGYTWKVVPAGASVDAPTAFTGTTTDLSMPITGLSSGTSYDFYVRTTCTDRNLLRWTNPIQFTTGCPSLTNFPFIENFETTVGQSLPNCWTQTQVSGTPKYWRTEPTSGQLNTRSVSIQTAYDDEEYLILPQITLNGNQRLRYSTKVFDKRYAEGYAIKLSKTGKAPAQFNIALTDTMRVKNTEYRDTTHSLEAYSGTVYIAIHVPRANPSALNYLYFDDIVVEDIPQCLEPTVLRGTIVTADTAVLKWNQNGTDAARWQLYYGDSATVTLPYGSAALNGTKTIADSNFYTLCNLVQNKTYKWWVRRICGVGDTSRWSNVAYLNTPPACGQPTNIVIATDSTTARLRWTTNKRPTSWLIYYGLSDTTRAPTLPKNGLILTATDTSFVLPNLKYPKQYSLWIQSNCDTTVGNSTWSDKTIFQTYNKNDYCSNALLMPIDPNYATALTHPTLVSIGAEGLSQKLTCQGSDPSHLNDVWYKFVTPNNGQKVIIRTTSTNSGNTWVIALYDSCGGTALMCNIGNDPLNYQAIMNLCPYQYTPNKTYYIRMFPYDYASSTTTGLIIYNDPAVCPDIPRNDSFETAIRFSRLETVNGTNFLGTDEHAGLPSCEDGTKPMYDVWYKFSSGSGAERMLNADLVLRNSYAKSFKMTVYKASRSPAAELTWASNRSFCVSIFNSSSKGRIPIWGMEENQDYYVRVWSNTVPNQGRFELFFENVEMRDAAFAAPVYTSDDCTDISRVTIDSTNNNRWVPIRFDNSIDAIAEIKANGQNLGIIELTPHSSNDTLRHLGTEAYLARNMFLSAQYPPTAPIQMRFYLTGVEWDTLQANYPTLSDTTFRMIRMVGASGCKFNLDTVGFVQTRMSDATLQKLNEDYCIEFTTSELAHFFVTGIPPTEFSYPPLSFCKTDPPQNPVFVGATGGTFTSTPAGLTLNPKTGVVTPATSTPNVYDITYTFSDLYGGKTVQALVVIDTPLAIIQQPVSKKILTVGTPIKLSVGTKGSFVGYQWQKNGIDLFNSNGEGEVEDSLIIAATSLADTGMYSVIVESACGRIVSNITHVTTLNSGINVSVKVFLQGAFNTSTGLMNDNLRTLNLIPTVEPYGNLATFTHIKGNKGAGATPSVLAVSGSTAIVDWVFLELRDATTPSVIVATQSVLVRRDGVLVDVEGNASIYFDDVPEGNYYISIRHRTHLGIRTANALTFVKGTPTSFDFTTPMAEVYVNPTITTNPPTKTITVAGVDYRTLWTGDINQDGFVKYNGSKNDRSIILLKVGGILTNTASGYFSEDINLNGIVKYNGSLNDRSILLLNVGGILTNVLRQHL